MSVSHLTTFEYIAAAFATVRRSWQTSFPFRSDKIFSTYPPCSLLRYRRKQRPFAVEDDLHSLLIQVWVEGQKNVGSWKEFVSDSSIKIRVLILPQLTCNGSQEFLSQKWGQTYWLFFLSLQLFNTGQIVLIIKLSQLQVTVIVKKDAVSRSKYPLLMNLQPVGK